jgi:hypothetical protein
MCLSLKEAVQRCTLSLLPLPSATAVLGLLQGNRGGDMNKEDQLSPGNLASFSSVTMGGLAKGKSQGEGWRAGTQSWPIPLPSHGARLGAALGVGCPLGPAELSPGPLQTPDLWAVFFLGSAPAPNPF